MNFRKKDLKFAHKNIVEFMDFKEMIFIDENAFALKIDNISSYVEHRSDSVNAP